VLDDLVVLHLHVEALLVPVDQLLQGWRQVAVSGDHGDELADVQAAFQREVTADRVEQEGRDLREQVVQELDHKLPLEDAEADVEQLEQSVPDLGPLPSLGVMDVDGLDPVHHLADPAGEAPRGELALFAEPEQLAPQARDDGELDADDAPGEEAEPDVLQEDEGERRHRLRAEEGRQYEGVADEAADRLDLVLHDGRRLRRLDRAQGLGREAQDEREQIEAHPPQHALTERPLGDVDVVLEGAVDQDEQQEQAG
jgi:hypothetical protein